MKYHSLTIAGLKYQVLSSSVALYLCLHTSAAVVLTADRLTGTIIHMSFKINTHESRPLHETNEAADPLDSLMTWLLLTAAERHMHDRRHSSTEPPHLTSAPRHQYNSTKGCTATCKSDSYIHYPSGLTFMAHINEQGHIKAHNGSLKSEDDLWETFVKVLESYTS